MTTNETHRDIWELLEDASGNEIEAAIADLYHWSTNYDAGRGPFTLFLDLIGWSEDELGEMIYPRESAGLGYVELSKLAAALTAYADHPLEVRSFVDVLMRAESEE